MAFYPAVVDDGEAVGVGDADKNQYASRTTIARGQTGHVWYVPPGTKSD